MFVTRAFPTLKFFKSGCAVKIVDCAKELEKTSEANDVAVFVVVDAEKGESRTLLEKLADTDDQAMYVAHQQGRDGGRRRRQQGGAAYKVRAQYASGYNGVKTRFSSSCY
ncbi:hypothetical protein PR002_g30677 [Phytophthora rubi]|uniref:Uncharacterized protein n=1 Tax=Phytophthora rubi TaxID=129364 RepID=A0A6A3GNQ1_9STRA|nr:hypothetical protein PR002_g30677 [Phytophthora rubi]